MSESHNGGIPVIDASNLFGSEDTEGADFFSSISQNNLIPPQISNPTFQTENSPKPQNIPITHSPPSLEYTTTHIDFPLGQNSNIGEIPSGNEPNTKQILNFEETRNPIPEPKTQHVIPPNVEETQIRPQYRQPSETKFTEDKQTSTKPVVRGNSIPDIIPYFQNSESGDFFSSISSTTTSGPLPPSFPTPSSHFDTTSSATKVVVPPTVESIPYFGDSSNTEEASFFDQIAAAPIQPSPIPILSTPTTFISHSNAPALPISTSNIPPNSYPSTLVSAPFRVPPAPAFHPPVVSHHMGTNNNVSNMSGNSSSSIGVTPLLHPPSVPFEVKPFESASTPFLPRQIPSTPIHQPTPIATPLTPSPLLSTLPSGIQFINNTNEQTPHKAPQ
jgi:hypothetical protein